ncbi:DUF47 domain-containing protein [Ihubacter sp. rT4E-8]|uniref:DUF47 domain-containing protein n=1 Tax=Ihubacter sp. rT4E-8 TaxID=3242369 RepID=UPI003CE69A67
MAKKSFFKKQEQPNFYYMLSRQCEITSRSISLLLKYIDTQEEDLAEQIEHCEKDADKVRRSLIDYVENSFITPLDRHDIFALSRSIDDITDKIKDLKDFLVFFQYQPTDKNLEIIQLIDASIYNLTCAMNEWAHDRIEHFWDDLVKAKKNENQVKRLYWEGIADLEFQEITLKDVIMQREFAKDLNKLANKIGKAADRISDIKIKSIK